MPGRFVAPIVGKRDHGCVTELVMETPVSFQAEPGQFVHVHCGGGSGRILRRPYSLYDVRDNTAALLVRVVGTGSEWLAVREAGESIDFLGPLGRGFSAASSGRYALVAGGTGLAPLRFLERHMRALGVEVVMYWGMDRGDDYGGLPGLLEREMDLRPASLDGTLGFKGGVLDLFYAGESGDFDGVYACGPRGMLTGLAETIRSRGYDPFQVSLEERMACGVGACRGCAVPSVVPAGGYLMVCGDGPVFNGREIDWKRVRESIWE